jgi:hypothetical protein
METKKQQLISSDSHPISNSRAATKTQQIRALIRVPAPLCGQLLNMRDVLFSLFACMKNTLVFRFVISIWVDYFIFREIILIVI